MIIRRFTQYVFCLYEQPWLRNWCFTLAVAIFVPTGCRFAVLAWKFGAWLDKPLAVVSGIAIGATAGVTLLRVCNVPPQRTVDHGACTIEPRRITEPHPANASELLQVSKLQAARNRQMARDAAALGSTRT
jgi:hypothetical protein